MKSEALLATRFDAPVFSAAFASQSNLMGLRVLGDLSDLTVNQLAGLPGFTYTWLAELTGYLEREGGMELLQPLSGKNPGQAG